MAAPSPDLIRGALLSGNSWSGPVITFSIPRAGSAWSGYIPEGQPHVEGYAVLNDAQAAAFRELVANVDRVIATPIVERDDLAGDIRIAFSPKTNHAYYPSSQESGGDIWLDAHKDASWTVEDSNKYTSTGPRQLVLHELGHALGLKHPHEGGQTLPIEYDSIRYSMMSYVTSADTIFYSFSAAGESVRFIVPDGPMVDDILALQALYGADTETAVGNDTYSWAPGEAFFEAIWDAGGHDAIDLSAHDRPSVVDLTPGAYSSIGYFTVQQQIDYWTGLYPGQAQVIARDLRPWNNGSFPQYIWKDNLGIAYGTVIEEVRAGSGADTIAGNAAGNVLLGNVGNDLLYGREGDDFLRGGTGDDRLEGGAGFDDLQGNTGVDTVLGGMGQDWVLGGQGNDMVSGDEGADIVNGNIGDDTASGGVGADTVRGGQGDDLLAGGDGDDFLSGDRGSDTITGGGGADRYYFFVGSGLDRITDFNGAEGDRIELQAGGYTLARQGGDAVLTLSSGDRLVLASVDWASLEPGWIVAI